MTRAEPIALVKQTIKALLAIKGDADEILIIDNNHTNEALYRPLAQYCDSLHDSLKVRFHHVDFIEGYKAGALNLALTLMDKACDYIVVIDSDYQVQPWARSSIINAIQRYPEHALLQFPQYYRDADKPDIHAELNYYFSRHLAKPLNTSRTLSTGTCAVIRQQALLELGGWSDASITEDAQMGVLMHLKGERTRYVNEIIATGMLPQTMADLIAQRRRWIYGNMQVMTKYLKTGLSQLALAPDSASFYNKSAQLKSLKPPIKKSPIKKLPPKYLKAHLSQLSAWVNLTGIFIILHGGCLAVLITAHVLGKPTLIEPTLKVLSLSYLSYAVFMGRKLISYLSDSQPLTTPAGTMLDESSLSLNASNATISSNAIRSSNPIKAFDSTRHSLNTSAHNRTVKTHALNSDTRQKPNREVIKLNTSNAIHENGESVLNASKQIVHKQVRSQLHKLSTFSAQLRKKLTIKLTKKLNVLVKADLASTEPALHEPSLHEPALQQTNTSTNTMLAPEQPASQHTTIEQPTVEKLTAEQPATDQDNLSIKASAKSPTKLPVRSSIISRVRAWLVHLSFWELGALSWFPVLWGQKKPFVCTPKSSNLQSAGRERLATLVVLPKLVMTLNGLTALLVLPYSPLLFGCALAIFIIKLSACWVVMSNFAMTQASQKPNRTIVFKKPNETCHTSEPNLA